MKKKKVFTVGQFLDAVEKNNYKKARGALLKYTQKAYFAREESFRNRYYPRELVLASNRKKDAEVFSACAIGQGALNLDIEPQQLDNALATAVPKIRRDIVSLNDNTGMSVSEIGRKMKEKYGDMLTITFEVEVE